MDSKTQRRVEVAKRKARPGYKFSERNLFILIEIKL